MAGPTSVLVLKNPGQTLGMTQQAMMISNSKRSAL